MHTLFVEPFGGMAGDMFLAALLDLGDPRFNLGDLRELAETLVPGESRIDCERVWRGSLSGTLLTVTTPESGSAPHRRYADLAEIVRGAPLPDGCGDRALAVLRRIAEAEARVHDTTPEEIHFHEVGAVDTLVDVCGAAIWRIVRKAARRAGIEGDVSPHWLRHAHASHALERGAPMALVRDSMGHSSVSTTNGYLHARPNDSSALYLAV